MTDDLRSRADHNLAEAAAAFGLADPRPAFRERLRSLKDEQPDAFNRALRHYDDVVMPALAAGDNVMDAWVQYGMTIAALTAPGRLVQVDGTGKSGRYMPPVRAGLLVLHLPDDNSAPALVAAAPAAPTAAQQATLDLLVNGRLGLRSA